MVRMNVSFEESLVERLRRLVPRRQRSQFISRAVREKLDLLNQERAVMAAAGLWKSEGRSDPAREIRKLRRTWKKRAERVEQGGG